MNVKKKTSKAIIFVVLLALIFSSVGFGGRGCQVAYAGEGTLNNSITLSLQSGGFIVPKQKVTVSSNLAEMYGYNDKVSSSSAVSTLDVLVKAHELAMGITGEPTSDNIDTINNMLKLSSDGFISTVMGTDTSLFGFTVNGSVPNDGTKGSYGYNGYAINQASVSENDDVEFFIYQDTSALDNYAWFENNSKRVNQLKLLTDTDVTLRLKGYCIGWYGLSVTPSPTDKTVPIEDAQIVMVNKNTGTTTNCTGKLTDENGVVSLKFSTPGTYIISAVADEYDSPLIMPWMEINVIDPSSNIPSDIPTSDVPAMVTITDANTTYVTKQALDIGWFDIRPFMTSGEADYALSNKILTANALIEAVYYKLYGQDPSREDLDVTADSTTAQAIKAQLNIYNGSWGLSTGTVFGNDKLLMSAINNSFGDSGIGGDQVSSGDDIVFYSYDEEYAYFDLLNVSTSTQSYSGVTYPIVNVKLKVEQKTYPNIVTAVSGAGIYLAGNSYKYGTTDDNGIANAEFWGAGISTGTTSGAFLITAEANGVIHPYLRIEYMLDHGAVTVTKISQEVLPDTSLSSFMVNAYGTAMDVSAYASNNRNYDVDQNISAITLSAITADSNAVIGLVAVSGAGIHSYNLPNATGGAVSIPIDLGLNQVSFTVTNGSAQETHTLIVNRNTEAIDNISAAKRIINGIADYSGYADSVYDYNWIMGKKGAGKTVGEAQKNAFLTQVINGAESLNVGAAAKTAMALTALNIDATKVPVKNSNAILNLVSQVYNYTGNTIPLISYVPYMLMLEDLGTYEIPANAKWNRAKLIQYVLDNYSTSSGWSTANGIDSAAMMIPALAPYYKHAEDINGYNGVSQASCAAIKVKVDETVQMFKTLQQSDGSFGNNANTTAVVIAALASLGIDADGTDFTKEESAKSALGAIFSYETSDHKMGFTSTEYSEFASKDALAALASYLKYYANGLKNGDGCIYRFNESVTPYTSWPDADLLTSIKVTPPTRTTYSSDTKETNYSVDTTGMIVKGMLNGDASKTISIPVNECTVSTIDCSKTGTQTVTVSYQGYTATFMVKVSDGTVIKEDTVSVLIKSDKKTVASSNSVVIQKGKTTAMDVLKTVLDEENKNYVIKSNYYVSEIDGLGEFDKGVNSGWLYSVNGVTPPTTAANEYTLQPSDSVVWYYTLDYTKDPSSSSWVKPIEAVKSGESSVTVTTEVTAKLDSDGKATAQISTNQITDAMTKVMEAIKSAQKEVKSEIKIKVNADSNAKTVEAVIPKAGMTALNKVNIVTLNTPLGDISFPADAINTIAKEANGDVKIMVSKRSASAMNDLSDNLKNQLKDRPVFDLSVSSGNNQIANFLSNVEVSVPYTAANDEDPKEIIVYYIKDNQQVEIMKNCRYDASSKEVKFVTKHFSQYAIGYNNIGFTDTEKHWANSDICYLAARDVIKGKQEKIFEPNSQITRAEFVQILANLWGEDLSKYTDSKFIDVPDKAWYSKSIAWAVENGIAGGTGKDMFSPNANITRQDMSVMISKYAANMTKEALQSTNSEVKFADEQNISGYAKDAVTAMQKAGIINGVKNTLGSYSFNPRANATRAEAATMIANYINN